jgi:hypothetical protein
MNYAHLASHLYYPILWKILTLKRYLSNLSSVSRLSCTSCHVTLLYCLFVILMIKSRLTSPLIRTGLGEAMQLLGLSHTAPLWPVWGQWRRADPKTYKIKEINPWGGMPFLHDNRPRGVISLQILEWVNTGRTSTKWANTDNKLLNG